MNKLITLALLALGSTFAAAHGDAMYVTAKKSYDPAKVEERSFGHGGNPKKVTRVIRLEMSDALRFTPSEVTVKLGETVLQDFWSIDRCVKPHPLQPAAPGREGRRRGPAVAPPQAGPLRLARGRIS